MLVCPDRECGYRKTTSQTSNARCPECHKKMELKGQGDGKVFVCACGYREKLSSFTKRKEKTSDKVSKREVSKYLKQQASQDSGNDALREAFAKLNLT